MINLKINNIAILTVAAVIFFIGTECRSEEIFRTRTLDFNNTSVASNKNTISVSPTSLYTKKIGYGLLTKGCTGYISKSTEHPINNEHANGITNKGAVEFRVDVPNGFYAAELVMAGGEKAVWQGAISVNERVIKDSCISYSMETEGGNPPAIWKFLIRVKAENGALVFKINAAGQPSTLASIMLFSDDIGPIEFTEGVYRKRENLLAPNGGLALQLINAGDIVEASRIVDAIPDAYRIEKAHLLFAMASQLNAQTPRALVEYGRSLLLEEKMEHPSFRNDLSIHLADLYIQGDQLRKAGGWGWSSEINQTGIFQNTEIAGSAFEEIASVSGHPLWVLGTWSAGITAYWVWVEQHFKLQIIKAENFLLQLAKYYGNYPLLKTYLGKFPVKEKIDTTPADVPQWAFLQHKLTSRMLDIIYYWTEKRQAENGEFGGKYDDDCEMLRWWPFARVAIDDPIALKGMKRLVDGMWTSEYVYKGFSKYVRDVEHSSEPIADTQPMMIGFDYGNPIYVERCMQSVKMMNDLWTGITPLGHRHFRSSWYSSTAMDTTAPKSCDVSMNTRTVKAVRWVAWYNQHPTTLSLVKEWSDSWLEDCMRTDKGKPKGIVPAGIRFQDDAIGGFSDSWHHPGMFWSYYDFDGEPDMQAQLLSAGLLFSDKKYFEPTEYALELINKYSGKNVKDAAVGSEAWAVKILQGSSNFWGTAELWRGITHNTTYDKLLMTSGSSYMRFRLSGNDESIVQHLRSALQKVENNFSLLTTEGYYTDRIEIRDLREQRDNGATLLESMYLGSPLVDSFYPFPPITWKGFSSDFSAFVINTEQSGMAVRVYNHSQSKLSGSIIFGQLAAGKYLFLQGQDANNDGTVDVPRVIDTVIIERRNSSFALSLLPRKEELIEVKQLSVSFQPAVSEVMCDLAVTSNDLQIDRKESGNVTVTCPIHNIGTKEAKDITVTLERIEGSKTISLSTTQIQQLNAPLDLEPKIIPVQFSLPFKAGTYRIRVSTKMNENEITFVNNNIEFTLQ
ncbi:MAG: hypothetical protein Q8L88_06940 [Bacteroidota bacterium]|nr:hypothetical protein [Bacteroidota bacterium]